MEKKIRLDILFYANGRRYYIFYSDRWGFITSAASAKKGKKSLNCVEREGLTSSPQRPVLGLDHPLTA